MHISVIGTGYVGLVTGACFAEFGVNVTCMDNDSRRIEKLKKGEIPFFEPGVAELVAKGSREGRLNFTTDIAQAVDKALAIFIAVGTPPSPDGSADLSFVKEVGRGIALHMNSYKVIVTKSTVPVGTGEAIREVVKKAQKTPIRFDMVSNPEFLREGSAIEDFMRPNRVVIGADSDQAVAIMKDLYRPGPSFSMRVPDLEGHASRKIWRRSFKPVNATDIRCRLPPRLRMSTMSNGGGWSKRFGMPSAD